MSHARRARHASLSVTTREDLFHDRPRAGQTLDEAIAAEVEACKADMAREIAGGTSEAEFVEEDGDRAIWDGMRLAAVVRPRVGAGPEVLRFDRSAPAPAATPAAPAIDPRGIVCTGKFFGDPITMRFISKAEWDAIPADEKPRALKEVSGAWYATFDVPAWPPRRPDVHATRDAIDGGPLS